jgi:hypothetical protein
MNEKILELAEKAGFISKKHNGDEWRWGYIDPELKEKLEKFAELIVRMSADAADMAYDARCDYVGDYVGEYMGYGEEQSITTWRMAE